MHVLMMYASSSKCTLLIKNKMCLVQALKEKLGLGTHLVACTCNPSTQEAKTRLSGVQGQPGLHSKALSFFFLILDFNLDLCNYSIQ